MPFCSNCKNNESLPDFPYCRTCSDAKLPSKSLLTEYGQHTIEYIQNEIKKMSDNAKIHPPKYIPPKKSVFDQYMALSFKELKEKEQEANEWLINHKQDPIFQEAKKKYDTLVRVLNLKAII